MIPHINLLVEKCGVYGYDEGVESLSISRSGLRFLLQLALDAVSFDENWYLEAYPDVAEAVKKGAFESGRDHFLRFGYFEGRALTPSSFSEKRYLKANPDIVDAIGSGHFEDAKDHFVKFGYAEGRNY